MTSIVVHPPNISDEEAVKLLKEHAPSQDLSLRTIGYGTAGFREKVAETPQLMSIMIRTAAFAVMQSLKQSSASSSSSVAWGIMITASHNDESYNGVKIAGPDGGMMASPLEPELVRLANLESVDEVWEWIIAQRQQGTTTATPPLLYIGRDTRSHSLGFSQAMTALAAALGARVLDLGVVTTPMLHHAVMHANFVPHLPKTLLPPRPLIGGYRDLLAYSYVALLQTKLEQDTNDTTTSNNNNKTLTVDCACGVGYPALNELISQIQEIAQYDTTLTTSMTRILPTNGPGMGPLNQQCGSEHVQKGICSPVWYENDTDDDDKSYCAAFDGDADRIVFFKQGNSDDDKFLLLDGDKIACLLCEFVQEQLQVVQTAMNSSKSSLLKLGVVQTAYANGASTDYLQKHVLHKNDSKEEDDDDNDAVLFTKTGVKHLHAAAHEQLDIGIYFEANGHGTILFGPRFYQFMGEAQQAILFATDDSHDSSNDNLPALAALQRLALLPSLVNQAVGDAQSDLLLVDAILYLKGWTLDDWYQIYQDYPSRQVKVKVEDRTMIQTNHNETRCTSPPEVQVALDQAMADMIGSGGVARTFVRPSGTEDVVRIYAEASTREQADELARQSCAIVYKLCKGVGDLPSIP